MEYDSNIDQISSYYMHKITLGYFLRGQTRQEVITSFFVIVMARGQIVARGQVFIYTVWSAVLLYNTIDLLNYKH